MNKNMMRYVRSVNDGEENYYTKVDNRLIKSENLSCEEKMIIIHCLSQNDSYRIIKEVLRNQLGLGVKSFTKAWKNLEKLGCIEDHGQTIINGQFSCKRYVINEYPDILKKLDKINIPKKQEVMGDINSENNTSDTVDTLVHDGKALNVKSTDGIQIDAEVYISKATCNNNQSNQHQVNQHQSNQYQVKNNTNDFDENQNSSLLPILQSEQEQEYYQEAKQNALNYLQDFQSDSFYLGWYNYEREIEFKSEMEKKLYENLNYYEKAWISSLYKWILFVNEKYFCHKVDSWRLNRGDMQALLDVSSNDNLPAEGWEGAFQVMNQIAENAYYLNKDKVTVSYLTKQLNSNICLV